MQAFGYLAFGPNQIDGGGSCRSSASIATWSTRTRRLFTASAHRNHYAVLGVPPNASSADIKKAYRLLARKYHPDVNKGVGATEAFKNIRQAYDVLINDVTRSEYDRTLDCQKRAGRPGIGKWDIDQEYEDRLRFDKWAYMRRKERHDKYYGQYHDKEREFSFYDDTDEVSEREALDRDREPFSEVLKSALLSLFLMLTVGIQLSLTFSTLMAMIDQKLDRGYKFGYLCSWILGGRDGILLTMVLSVASWVCGKTSSSVVALGFVAMCIGSSLRSYGPLPQGALLTLLYMSIKLQTDLK